MSVDCKVCGRKATYPTKQLCHTHNEKLRRTGTLIYLERPKNCKACGRSPVVALGYCQNDYMKLRRTGTLERVRFRRTGWTKADWKRYTRYRVEPEEYQNALVLQENACAICRRPFTDELRPNQDHDHSNDQCRGLLCRPCNTVLGHLERVDIPAEWFAEYLHDWQLWNESDDEDVG